ncbi:hypothetical protein IBX65_08960, partial [Candidatus Aerophobetes bacterium]|nr:hypothetical protein [Candidatus Aerophobetes bacterium]
EQAVERLSQAQAATEKRVGGLEKAMEKLAQAQTRTEQAVERLSQAQAATEKRVGRLEKAMERLTQAQTRADQRMERLEKAVERLAREVGGLSATIGFGLEDIGRVVLPGYLERHYNVYVPDLNRKFFRVNKTDVEIDFYGEGNRNGEKVIILGEAKSKIYEREVKGFLQRISKITSQFDYEILKIMFGYLIHPTATEVASKEGVILIASYQR